MVLFLFYTFATVAVLSAFAVITASKPTRALLALVATMLSLAVVFLLLGAYFVAMVHVIVYAGAVLVLFLFVIMLQGLGASDIPFWQRFPKPYLVTAVFSSLFFLGVLSAILTRLSFAFPQGVEGTVERVGEVLFRRFLLPFEMTSLLLLLAVFAAVAFAKKEEP